MKNGLFALTLVVGLVVAPVWTLPVGFMFVEQQPEIVFDDDPLLNPDK